MNTDRHQNNGQQKSSSVSWFRCKQFHRIYLFLVLVLVSVPPDVNTHKTCEEKLTITMGLVGDFNMIISFNGVATVFSKSSFVFNNMMLKYSLKRY